MGCARGGVPGAAIGGTESAGEITESGRSEMLSKVTAAPPSAPASRAATAVIFFRPLAPAGRTKWLL